MNENNVAEPQDSINLSDLIALYRALQRACEALDCAAEKVGQGGNARAEIEKALIRDERAEIAARMTALRREIITAPVQSRRDAYQALRFQLIEFGDNPAFAEAVISEFFGAGKSAPARDETDILRRLDDIENLAGLIAMALSVDATMQDKAPHLQNAAEFIVEEIDVLRGQFGAPAKTMTDAA